MSEQSLLTSFISRQVQQNTNRKQSNISSEVKSYFNDKMQEQKIQINDRNSTTENKIKLSTIQKDDFKSDVKFKSGKKRLKKIKMSIEDSNDENKLEQEKEIVLYQYQYSGKKQPQKTSSKPNINNAQYVNINNGKNCGNNNVLNRGVRDDEDQEFKYEDFTDSTPVWAIQGNSQCLDSKGRHCSHPEYDEQTLLVPQGQWKKFSAPMRQFWHIKSSHFDKLVLFKLGKFYELFYQDALITNRYLELKWMGSKMHTGFPQKCLEKYADQLVRLGFKVVVVEQMETPDQMNDRVKSDRAQGRKSQKTLQRDITQIFTKGTKTTTSENSIQNDTNYMPNYLIAVYEQHGYFSYCLLEVSRNLILVGLVETFDEFKTILYQTRPVQLVYHPDNLPHHYVAIMKQSMLQMVMSKLSSPKEDLWHHMNAINVIQDLVKNQVMKSQPIFQAIQQLSCREKKLLYCSMAGLFCYLKKIMKFDYVMGVVTILFFNKENYKTNMILDSQALQHLELFQTVIGSKGSLFEQIDKTRTKMGKRLLRRWLMTPLLNEYKINQRLNALQDLQGINFERNKVMQGFKKIPDLQKITNRLYHYAVKTTASKAVYFEDVSSAKLRQFKQFIQQVENACTLLLLLQNNSHKFKSIRLKQLVTYADHQKNTSQNQLYFEDQQSDQLEQSTGLLPSIMEHIQQFNSYIQWKGDTPFPQKGLVQSFDSLEQQVDKVKSQLFDYLEQLKEKFKEPNLKFTHTKQRYEVEIPDRSERKKPKQFTFTSKRAGFSRYISPCSQQLVKQLEAIQEQLKQQMTLFVGFFFEEFKKKQKIWQQFIVCVAQIDCLMALSAYSFQGSMVRPTFATEGIVYQVYEGKHPCLTSIDFIANDIIMQQDTTVMLLTGPNMGGKSTILRTTCLLAIMAQIGCYVPAKGYHSHMIDRIFTRIGASDKLQQGKSTFFIEMEETKSVLKYATSKSLVIMDQLGRGTSTFDGMAIAYAVLKDIVQRIQCKCLFATHYHSLLQQFRLEKGVSFKMMDCLVTENGIVFLYKLRNGQIGSSFAINVAKIVGISSQIRQKAKKHSDKMLKDIEQKRKNTIIRNIYSLIKDQNL